MQNFPLLERAGRSKLPVLLKRGMAATLEEWLLAAEYIMAEGNYNVILCERGVRTFAQHTRNTLDLAAVVCWTSSGSTGLRVARERPRPPIVALSPIIATGRRLSVVWGVHCVITEDAHDQDDMIERAGRIAFTEGFAKAGQRVIIVAGVPLRAPGTTNMLRIASVGPDDDAEM